MNIHAIQTGTVALTMSWREGVGPDTATRLAQRQTVGAALEQVRPV